MSSPLKSFLNKYKIILIILLVVVVAAATLLTLGLLKYNKVIKQEKVTFHLFSESLYNKDYSSALDILDIPSEYVTADSFEDLVLSSPYFVLTLEPYIPDKVKRIDTEEDIVGYRFIKGEVSLDWYKNSPVSAYHLKSWFRPVTFTVPTGSTVWYNNIPVVETSEHVMVLDADDLYTTYQIDYVANVDAVVRYKTDYFGTHELDIHPNDPNDLEFVTSPETLSEIVPVIIDTLKLWNTTIEHAQSPQELAAVLPDTLSADDIAAMYIKAKGNRKLEDYYVSYHDVDTSIRIDLVESAEFITANTIEIMTPIHISWIVGDGAQQSMDKTIIFTVTRNEEGFKLVSVDDWNIITDLNGVIS